MEGLSKHFNPRSIAGLPWLWLLATILALGPFLMGISLDLAAVEREAFGGLYEKWRWSPEGQALKDIGLLRMPDSGGEHRAELWRSYVQVHHLVDADADNAPTLLFYSTVGDLLSVRIEHYSEQGDLLSTWVGHQRMVNNGIWLGAWVGLILYVLGLPFMSVVACHLLGMLFWYGRWDFFNLPMVFYENLRWPMQNAQFQSVAVLMLSVALLWMLCSFMARKFLIKFHRPQSKELLGWMLLAFVLEPVFLYMGSRVGLWAADAKWWLVYVGSFEYRFITIACVLWVLFETRGFKNFAADMSWKKQQPVQVWVVLLPVVFLLCDGWSWAQVALNIGDSVEGLLRVKAFWIGMVLAFGVGSRVMSLFVLALLYAMALPPSQGHAVAAAYYGSLMDGAFVGWMMTIYKGVFPVLPLLRSGRLFIAIAFLGWGLGIFLTSVEVPTAVVWPAYLLAIWALYQIRKVPSSGA